MRQEVERQVHWLAAALFPVGGDGDRLNCTIRPRASRRSQPNPGAAPMEGVFDVP